jgi:hypothetical protein
MSRVLWIVALIAVIVSAGACAQEQANTLQEPKTKMESFQRQTGTIMIKGYAETGTIDAMGSVSVECVELTDATTSRHQTGIVIEVKESCLFRRLRTLIPIDCGQSFRAIADS